MFDNDFVLQRAAETRVSQCRKAPKKWELNDFGDGGSGVGEFVSNFRAKLELMVGPFPLQFPNRFIERGRERWYSCWYEWEPRLHSCPYPLTRPSSTSPISPISPLFLITSSSTFFWYGLLVLRPLMRFFWSFFAGGSLCFRADRTWVFSFLTVSLFCVSVPRRCDLLLLFRSVSVFHAIGFGSDF